MKPARLQEEFVDLYAVPRMNETRLKRLLARFGEPEKILAAKPADLEEVRGIDAELAAAIAGYKRSAGTRESIKSCRAAGVRTVAFTSPDFPAPLRDLAHMPPVLFMLGEVTDKDRQAIALVGTRRPSFYGRQIAEKLGRELAGNGVTVVSGLARGIDTFAHKGALAAGGRTIAVLGCGIDVYYPPENRQLQNSIPEHGAVTSEFPPGMEPMAMNFPKRNRIVSGLSQGVVAVEAGEKSGVLNTVAWAVDQGRDVYAVPGNLTSPQSTGTNRLLKEGARPVWSVEDILSDLGIKAKREARARVEVSADEKPVLEYLSGEPKYVDDICESLGIPVATLLSLLMQLELKGLVRQMPGKLFVREI